MFALLNNVAAPRERAQFWSTAPVFPAFCKILGGNEKRWCLSLHPVNTGFGHKQKQNSLPLAAAKVKTHPGATCTIEKHPPQNKQTKQNQQTPNSTNTPS